MGRKESNQTNKQGGNISFHVENNSSFVCFRHISGPHICGDAIDIDPRYNHILTGSWRREKALQV